MKRTMLLLLILGMLTTLFLAACAQTPEPVAPEEEAAPAEEEAAPAEEEAAPAEEEAAPADEEAAPAEEATEEEAAAECPVEGGTIKIGMIQPMSGAAATNGAHITAAAQVAVDNINAEGGVLGCDLALVIEDSQADAAVALSAAEKLINQDNVEVIIGAYHSHTTLAIMPILPDAMVPMVEVIATSPLITDENNGWVFRISSTNRIDAETAVTQCWDELGFENWAFLPVNNDWGKSVPATFQGVIEGLGGQMVLNEPLEQGNTNFLSQLTKLRSSDADTVAATIDVESLSILAKQAYEAGMTSDYSWVATSGNSVEEFKELLADTPEALDNWFFIAYYSPTLEGENVAFNQKFHDTFTAAEPDIPVSNPAAQGYQAVYIIAEAIERAGAYDGDAIRAGLTETDFQGLTGHLQFDENGQAVPSVHFQQFIDGEPIVVECAP